MKIRRSIATALAAGTVVLTIGFAAPANAKIPTNPNIQINPCVLVPGSCAPKPTLPDPKGPGDLTQDPCITHACPDPTVPPTTTPDPTTPTPSDPATPAHAVKATAAFTG